MQRSEEFYGYVMACIAGLMAGNSAQSPANIASIAVSIAIAVEKEIGIQLKGVKDNGKNNSN